MAVDNACATPVIELPDGTFESTHHQGPALGIRSVRMTAQATGGEARFEHDGDTFRASVLLGPTAVDMAPGDGGEGDAPEA